MMSLKVRNTTIVLIVGLMLVTLASSAAFAVLHSVAQVAGGMEPRRIVVFSGFFSLFS